MTPKFLSAEPIANNLIAVTTQGQVDFSTLTVKLNGKVSLPDGLLAFPVGSEIRLVQTVRVLGSSTVSPSDTPNKTITYLSLASPLAPGSLAITAGDASFSFTLPAGLSGS